MNRVNNLQIMRLLFIFVLFACLAFPQQPAPEPAQEPAQEAPETTFRTSVLTVVAPTLVMDRDGSFIAGLQPQDFALYDNSKAQDIKVDLAYIPISLVVCVQRNASAEAFLPKVQKVGSLLQGLVTGDAGEVAILSYDHRIEVKQDFTSDTDKIQAALKGLTPGSSSSRMIDAVIQATRMLRRRPENRRRIIMLIGESRDYGSEARTRDALTAMQMANVTLYPVAMNHAVAMLTKKEQAPRPDPFPPGARGMPAGVPMTPSSASQTYGNAANSGNVVPFIVEMFQQVKAIFVDNPMEVFSKWTGGREQGFIKGTDLETAIHRIGQELHAQYIISYNPSNKEEGGFHEIRVDVNRKDLGPLKTRTRLGYWVAARPNGQ